MSASPAESGEEVEVNTGEEGSQGGETGADDGHGRFNLRPHVTCDYGVFADVRVLTTRFLTSDLQVRSPPLTKSIVIMRIRPATHTLQASVSHSDSANHRDLSTYNAPKVKIPESAIFWRVASLRFHTMWSGMHKMIRSRPMFEPVITSQ